MVMNYVDVLHKENHPMGLGERPSAGCGQGWGCGGAGAGSGGGGGAPGPAAGIPETPCAGRPRLTAASHAGPTRTPPLRFPTK